MSRLPTDKASSTFSSIRREPNQADVVKTTTRLPEDIGARLENLLRREGKRASQVALALNIPKASLSCWIGRGSKGPRDPMIIKRLAEYFGVSFSYLFMGTEELSSPRGGSEEVYRFEVTIRTLKSNGGSQ